MVQKLRISQTENSLTFLPSILQMGEKYKNISIKIVEDPSTTETSVTGFAKTDRIITTVEIQFNA